MYARNASPETKARWHSNRAHWALTAGDADLARRERELARLYHKLADARREVQDVNKSLTREHSALERLHDERSRSWALASATVVAVAGAAHIDANGAPVSDDVRCSECGSDSLAECRTVCAYG